MKIALCVGNLASKGKQGEDAYIFGFNHLKKEIIDKYDGVDVFLHSYEIELKNELIQLYHPIDHIFELPPNFEKEYENLNEAYTSDHLSSPTYTYPNLFSMAYSRYSLSKLKTKHELNQGFKYDWVIFARYDISSARHIEGIYFDKTLDNNFIYTCWFLQLNAGPQDQWFYGNSKNMDIVLSLFENLTDYFTDNSDYINSVTNNWINSNYYDRYSCELLNNDTTPLMGEQIPVSRVANGHLIYKWHFYKNGLWNLNNLRFINHNYEGTDIKYLNHPNIINKL